MRVAAVSGSRADYSGLKVVADALAADGHAVEMVMSVMGDVDLALLHGDRHEVVVMAVEFVKRGIPIAHIGGGDVTAGSYDDKFRDALSMMAELHFVGHEAARTRLVGMGVEPQRVAIVGEPAIDWLTTIGLPSRETLLKRVGLNPSADFILLNWQPETMAEEPNRGLWEIIAALANAADDVPVLAVGQNDDRGGRDATGYIRAHARRGMWKFWPTLTRIDYAAAMKHCAFMIGNSSSGLIEGPTLGTPFINVGDRQKGRIAAGNVFSVPANRDTIAALIRAGPWPRLTLVNPYGDGHAAERIVEVVRGIGDPRALLRKREA